MCGERVRRQEAAVVRDQPGGARAASISASGLARLSRKTLLESVKEMLEISLERVIGVY